ncbi:glutathione S-transferase family protein [Pokkaliibacter sp. CJK22405]|uniref:glutathione S-transferase family protein n=1 Tax=Pokkaliibacter sp. CJK22405 TaxID=3384615 RepID=UPI0039848F1D
MLTLHHLENSRSQRIAWAMECLDLSYEIKRYARDPSMAAPEELKKIHPLGKAPILTDDELVLAESGAIIEYLIDRYDEEQNLRPATPEGLQAYRFWLHFAEGSLMPLLLVMILCKKMGESPVPALIRPIGHKLGEGMSDAFVQPRLEPQLKLIESTLAKTSWLAGNQLSGADIQMSFPLLTLEKRRSLDNYPNLLSYLKRIKSHSAFQRAMARVE